MLGCDQRTDTEKILGVISVRIFANFDLLQQGDRYQLQEKMDQASQQVAKYFRDMDNGLIKILKFDKQVPDIWFKDVVEESKTDLNMEIYYYGDVKFVEISSSGEGISTAIQKMQKKV